MKYTVLFLLMLTNLVSATEKKVAANKELHALTNLQKFDVITLISPSEQINNKVIYDSMTESFKKIGQVSISESDSMFTSLLQNSVTFPVCYFSIDRDEDQIEMSLQVLAEVEVLANEYKTTCPIWNKTLFSSVPEDNSQMDSVIASLAQEIIKSLAEDCVKANPSDSKKYTFQIRKSNGL